MMMRMSRCGGIILGITLLSGCYTYQPAGAASPEIGQEYAFDINDVGRVGLGASMGPEIAQVEGRLISRENAEYLVGITAVRTLRGGDILLAEDTTGQGHISRAVAGKPRRSLFITLD